MFLRKLANIIYEKGTTSEHLPITVRPYHEPDRVLWYGKAKDLQNQTDLNSWIVVEVLVDKADGQPASVPDYNRGKIITVI